MHANGTMWRFMIAQANRTTFNGNEVVDDVDDYDDNDGGVNDNDDNDDVVGDDDDDNSNDDGVGDGSCMGRGFNDEEVWN